MVSVTRRTILTAALTATLAGCSRAEEANPAAGTTTPTPTPPPPPPELPRGGRVIFPTHRLYGWCGTPGAPALGLLGEGDFDAQVQEMLQKAPAWAGGRTPLPVLELIATVVHSEPGQDGLYRARIADSIVDQWSAKAKATKSLLLINIQPGRADFLDEVKAYEKWLVEPHVGIALDPEWAIGPGEIPGNVFGHMTGAQVDAVSAYLASLVKKHDLPQKALVVHVLRVDILRQPEGMTDRPEIALVKSVDGIGVPENKVGTYGRVMAGSQPFVKPGFKLFLQEDVQAGGPIMKPAEVLALTPQPDYVMVE